MNKDKYIESVHTSTPVRTSWGRMPFGTINSCPRLGGWNGSSLPASIYETKLNIIITHISIAQLPRSIVYNTIYLLPI